MIPRTLFSSDHELFRDSVRKFLEQEAVPFHHQWEKDGHVDRALWNKAGEAGMLCSHLPEEYGGMGADFLYPRRYWMATSTSSMARRPSSPTASSPTW